MSIILALIKEMESASVHHKQMHNLSSSLLGSWTGSTDTLDANGHIVGSAVFEKAGRRHPSTSIF